MGMKYAALIFSIILFSACEKAQKEPKNDRFKLMQISDFRRDQYLLDSATGRLWVKVCSDVGKDGMCAGVSYWQRELVQNIDGSAP
jgi:hypothetical protein